MVMQNQRLLEDVRDQIDLSREVTDEEVLEIIEKRIVEESKRTFISLSEKNCLRKKTTNKSSKR